MLLTDQAIVSLPVLAASACERHADRIAYSCMGRNLGFAELDHLARCLALYLQQDLDLKPGDRLAIQLPNILQYPVVALAALYSGLVIVNTNPLYSARELRHQLVDSGARAIVVLVNTAAVLKDIIAETPVEHVITCQMGDLHGIIKGSLINFCARVKKGRPSLELKSCLDFPAAIGRGRSHRAAGIGLLLLPGDAEELAVLQYTGGTTGVSKAAMLSHRNLVTNMLQLREVFSAPMAGESGVMIAPLPLYHIYAFTINLIYNLHEGMHSVLVPDPRNLDSLVALLCRQPFSVFIGINTLYNALLNHPHIVKVDFSGLRLSSAAGMALSNGVARRWAALTGVEITEGYGLTEASPCVTCCYPGSRQDGAVGFPVSGTEIRITCPDGYAIPAGEVGEIRVRGPQVMRGYWQQPRETALVLDDEGWLRTGDAGFVQEDGQLRILDRYKDMINVSGFNVYPVEVEECACACPGVSEAVAIGVDSGSGGERVMLVVVPSDPALTAEMLGNWCRQHLTAYKVPRIIELRDRLPKSNVGKILRRVLRDEANARI